MVRKGDWVKAQPMLYEFPHLMDMTLGLISFAEMALVLSGKWPRACVNPTVLEKSKLERWQPFSMERGPGN